MTTFEQARQNIRRTLGLERYPAILGDVNGVVIGRPGYYRVRYTAAEGTGGLKNEVLADGYVGPLTPGTPVWVTYNQDGDLCVRQANAKGQIAIGGNPVLNNPGAAIKRDDENPFVFVPFVCHPTAPPSLSVVVRPWVYVLNGTVQGYAGEQVDLTGSFPAAGEQCLAGLFMKPDNTLETVTSTAQAVTDALDLTDVQELIDGASVSEPNGWIWRLTGGATALTDADKLMDLRAFVNTKTGGFEAYTPSGTADAHGKAGDQAYDDSYLYIKTGAGWKRAALGTF